MDLNLLRFFIVTAQFLHFGKAAEELGLAQPALSQKIMLLEKRIGVTLFDRSRRAVRLTPAGLVFLEEAQYILNHTKKAVYMARSAQNGLKGKINIGFGGSVIFEPHVSNLIKTFKSSYPEAAVLMHENKLVDNLNRLNSGELDVAILWGPLSPEYTSLASLKISKAGYSVVFHRDHLLAKSSSVSIHELKNENFITLMDPPGTGVGNNINLLLEEYNIQPKISLKVSSLLSIFGFAGAGLGVGIVPAIALGTSISTFMQLPLIESTEKNEILLIYSTKKKSNLMECFLKLASALAKDTR